MRKMASLGLKRLSCIFGLMFLTSLPSLGATRRDARGESFRVLVFSETKAFRHDSIPAARSLISRLAQDNHFEVVFSEDSQEFFSFEKLKSFDVVLHLLTTGDIFSEEEKKALMDYIHGGGNFVGIHSAADTELKWPWYGQLVGMHFSEHPLPPIQFQNATLKVLDRVHPSTKDLPEEWLRHDEWYNFRRHPRGKVHTLISIEEKSYQGGKLGSDHPLAWCQNFEGGRSWYTASGHTIESYSEPEFAKHILGGILWAAGRVPGDCNATVDGSFKKTILEDNAGQAMQMSLRKNGDVYYIERDGKIKRWTENTKKSEILGQISVDLGREDGLLGFAMDPHFDQNKYIYVYYSVRGASNQRLSRWTLKNQKLQMDSEKVLLEIPTSRKVCCHSGGGMVFDAEGNLYLGVGDNTNPFESEGYAPLDSTEGKEDFDAQRTAANSADFRGKILRIRPVDGEKPYSIPDGNLFPKDGSQGRPEIYIMGVRNPFRLFFDNESKTLFFGDVGPDAKDDDSEKGPKGYDEINRANSAGNFGWPYFLGPNLPYKDFDFTSEKSGPAFDPLHPVNRSRNNSGVKEMPPAQPALIWYPYNESKDFPELGNEAVRVANAGPVYRFKKQEGSEHRLPAYYDKTFFIFDWMRGWVKSVHFNQNGKILKIVPFLKSFDFGRPLDLQVGPDGRLYTIEWPKTSGATRIVRYDYYGDQARAPQIKLTVKPENGSLPLEVSFDREGSKDPQDPKAALQYQWDFEGTGKMLTSDSTKQNYIYKKAGVFNSRLTVTNTKTGFSSTVTTPITVGNTPPVLRFVAPPDGGIFRPGEYLSYELDIRDQEQKKLTESEILVLPMLAHDTHTHHMNPAEGLKKRKAQFKIELYDGKEHTPDSNLSVVLNAKATDSGGAGGASTALTGRTSITLQPSVKKAEHRFDSRGGQFVPSASFQSKDYCCMFDGSFLVYHPINFKNIHSVALTVANPSEEEGEIELRLQDPQTGPLLGKLRVKAQGEKNKSYFQVKLKVRDPGGPQWLFVVFKSKDIFFQQLEFLGPGVSQPRASK